MSPNTEREYREAFAAAQLLEGDEDDLRELHVLRAVLPQRLPPQQTSSITVWEPEVERLRAKGGGRRAIFDHLGTHRADFHGSYDAVKRLCRSKAKAAGPRPEDVAIPVETLPGEVAQVDFGCVGKLYDPDQHVLRKAYVFVMVLGSSRHMFAKVVFDQSATTWQQLHAEAFAFFGGIPETVVPDNLKAAVVRMAFGQVGEDGPPARRARASSRAADPGARRRVPRTRAAVLRQHRDDAVHALVGLLAGDGPPAAVHAVQLDDPCTSATSVACIWCAMNRTNSSTPRGGSRRALTARSRARGRRRRGASAGTAAGSRRPSSRRPAPPAPANRGCARPAPSTSWPSTRIRTSRMVGGGSTGTSVGVRSSSAAGQGAFRRRCSWVRR
jgi:hypothetical protein